MFDIGFAEILIVSVVALLVLGPEKLPVAVRTCGLWFGKIKRSVNSIQREINEELRIDELRRTAAITKDELDKELREMTRPFKEAGEQVRDAADEARGQPSAADASTDDASSTSTGASQNTSTDSESKP
ncbi:Sec-independent protein translocase protein TatB [Nitrincola alkalilacustris]|uniref:Sec-independent protein translocase protein TatB n=1 Tax=Nitrincola alkalilacustris TaxID=1571224 RepID=UPI00124E3489|nr:Sec-independent protein translocase protein TatB [Nitrincola alkalilacustris]